MIWLIWLFNPLSSCLKKFLTTSQSLRVYRSDLFHNWSLVTVRIKLNLWRNPQVWIRIPNLQVPAMNAWICMGCMNECHVMFCHFQGIYVLWFWFYASKGWKSLAQGLQIWFLGNNRTCMLSMWLTMLCMQRHGIKWDQGSIISGYDCCTAFESYEYYQIKGLA